MKTKSLLIAILISVGITKTQAQTGVITPSLGTGFFIEGVSPVNNTFTVTGEPVGTAYVDFYALDSTGTFVLDSLYDIDGSNGWQATFDMGWLEPGAIIYVEYYDSVFSFLGWQEDFLDILSMPDWLISGGSVSNVIVTGNTISMNASYSITAILDPDSSKIPSNIKAIGGKSFELTNSSIEFSVIFDMLTTNSTTSNIVANFTLNTLGQDISSRQINFSSGLSLDNDFNLIAIITDSISTPPYNINFPRIRFPIAPPLASITIDGGVSFYATLKGQIVIGQDPISTQWGFIDNGGQKTKIIAKATATGFVRATGTVALGLASVRGTLTMTGKIGVGFDYVSLPSTQINYLFGGDLDVSGELVGKLGWGLFKKTYGPKSFYGDSFGNYAGINKVGQSFDDVFGTSAISYKINATMLIPDNNPQPSFGTRDKNLYTVWVENDQTNGYLLFSKLDTNGVAFSPEIIVESNTNSIVNPKVAIMSSGSALITWTQNRYSQTSLPINATFEDIVNAQDIWMAIYDIDADDIVYTFRLDDDTTGFQTGRAEGEAKIAMGNGTEGLITWVAKDPLTETSDIWFSNISEDSMYWALTSPVKLANLPGINKDVNVAYTDSVNAIAVWINDPDGDDITLNSQIIYAEWDGITWSAPFVLADNFGDESFDELSMDYNDDFFAVAWTSTVFDSIGSFEKRLDVEIWDALVGQWDTASAFYDTDSMYYFQKPRVSISDSGLLTICYQAIDMFPDTNYIDPGELYLFIKDLYFPFDPWVEITGNEFLSDSTTFIWELDAGFGGSNRFYTITQEYNETTGIVTNPSNGILFGDPILSMVFRGLIINTDLTISDISEPTVPTGIKKLNANPFSFDLKQNYPNPFNTSTMIQYRIMDNSFVTLDIYDITGRQITRLVNQNLPAGVYQTLFESGNLQSGFYFYRLTIDNQSIIKKMIITK